MHTMEETPKKSFRNVARRYGATLENINDSRSGKKKVSKISRKKRMKREK
jgi:hypothetical protein